MRVPGLLAVLSAACGRLGFGSYGTADATANGDVAASCGRTFCDDFERAAPLELGWDMNDTTEGMLALDGGTLTATVGVVVGGVARLVKTLPDVQASVHVACDIALESFPGGEMDLVHIVSDRRDEPSLRHHRDR